MKQELKELLLDFDRGELPLTKYNLLVEMLRESIIEINIKLKGYERKLSYYD